MRKITSEAVNAFKNLKNFNRSNMSVQVRQGVAYMYLHGNNIAQYHKEDKELFLSTCGWETVTTKERLNGVLSSFGLDTIYQKDYIWYYGDKKPFNGTQTFKL